MTVIDDQQERVAAVIDLTKGSDLKVGDLAVAVQERITDVQSDLYHLKRVIERLQTREKADRRLLAVHLQGLIDDDPDALDDPWVQHWCINGGDKGLHKRVFRHIQWRQSSESSVDNPVGTAIKADG